MTTALRPPLFPLFRKHERSIGPGLRRLLDPKLLVLPAVPFLTGAALVWREKQTVALGIAAGALAAIVLLEVSTKALRILFDHRAGADEAIGPDERSPYSDENRVLAEHLLSERQLVAIASIAFAIAAAIGIPVTIATQPALLLLAGAAALAAVASGMPPLKLAYRGLGELAAFAIYGHAILLGTVALLGGTIGLDAVFASSIIGILVVTVMVTQELPAERADRISGKQTLVVEVGRDLATSLVSVMFALAFTIPLLLVAYGGMLHFAGALAGVPVSYVAYKFLRREFDRPPVTGQGLTLLTYVLTGAGLTIAALIV